MNITNNTLHTIEVIYKCFECNEDRKIDIEPGEIVYIPSDDLELEDVSI